ncbi:MAG: Gfo/Idh/MocA family oxidoreductase, partial [Pirellulales bacterium]
MTLHDSRRGYGRRLFLKGSVAGVAALGLSATGRLTAAPTSPNEKVRLGLIGLGWRGGQHLDALLKRSDCEVVALCDPEAEFLDAAKMKAPRAKSFRDMRGLLDDKEVDA